MSKKSEQIAKLLDKVELRWPVPEPLPAALESASLVDKGLYAILLRRIEPAPAVKAIAALHQAYGDWNELRVAQPQEIAGHLDLGAKGVAVARDARAYLQEVFQYSHGMSLEFLRDDPQAAARFVLNLPVIGLATAHWLMHAALPAEIPVTPGMSRVLDRLGFIARTTSVKKARAAIEPLANGLEPIAFATRIGEVASRWCDAKKPLCHLCILVEDCRFGRRAFREWKVQQERMVVQRARDAARLAVLQKKEEERRRKEAERAAKKAALEAAKKAREAERLARTEAKKREAEGRKAAALKAKLEAQRKREEQRARAKALAEQKKKEAAQKRAKEAAARKAAAKKAKAAKARARKAARKGERR